MSKVDEMGAGAVMGFQVPMGIKKRKKHVDELLEMNPDISEGHALMFFNGMSEEIAEELGARLEAADYNSVAEQIRMHAIREVVKQRVKEVVRKKPGGGGYVLYSPNQGKKKNPKPVGHFPTKLAAKRAELARFAPRDPAKLQRLRKDIDKTGKDPKKRANKETQASKTKAKEKKKEGVELNVEQALRPLISVLVMESLFREERTGSEWDEYIGRLSNQALTGDKKFQKHQQAIEKKTQGILENAFASIRKAVKKDIKLKSFGVKKSEEKGKTYLAFSAMMDNVAVEPIYIYVENGVPKIEVSDNAKIALTKANPDTAKLFRAELVTVQERVLDKMDDLIDAIGARDKYLERLEDEVDGFVAGLTPLQVSLLKQLLVKKYRKISS